MRRCGLSVPRHRLILESPDARILWDTGISVRAAQEWPPGWQAFASVDSVLPWVWLESRLMEPALGPNDFDYVVMSHLHIDHAGGLRLFGGRLGRDRRARGRAP